MRESLHSAELAELGRVDQEHRLESFDYLDFEVGYSGASGPPHDFRGFSGGGLWQVPVIRTPDGLKVKELLFSGVAFYQHAPQENHRRIKCHGRRTIYDQAVQSIEDAPEPRKAAVRGSRCSPWPLTATVRRIGDHGDEEPHPG